MILVRVLAKKCDVKWLTLKNLTTYFKRLKIHVIYEVNPFVSVDKKMISPYNEWYIGDVLVCAHFSSKLAHGT